MTITTRPETPTHQPPPPTTDAPRRPNLERFTDLIADRRLGVAGAAGAVIAWAVLAGWWTPRGPLTSVEALTSIVASLGVGTLAGLLARSRWAMLAAPALFAVVFELVRIGTAGPTVDAVSFSAYGMLAFAVGRGFHALVSLLPILFGAALGAGVARKRLDVSAAGAGLTARRVVAVLAGIGLVAFSVLLARPGRTAAIVDAAGHKVPGSVAELTTVDVNGHDLAMMIRGHSVDNPVALFLAGGPGGSEIGSMRNHLSSLEEHFTVVTWDQRGTGKSYPELDPVDTLTLDGAVADTIGVTNYLRDRFDQEQIYLIGQSWGSTLGVLAVQERPELYAAFIGTGQMVSQRETDRIFYRDALQWAADNGKTGLLADLAAIGEPPYEEVLGYELALANEQSVYPYDHSVNSEGEGQMSENLIVPEYTLIEQMHVLGGFLDTFSVLYPQLQDIDFRLTATELDVPVFFAQGAHEAPGRAELFNEWYPMIEAPIKELVVLDTSGHRPLFEQPDEFVGFMVDTVLAQTREG